MASRRICSIQVGLAISLAVGSSLGQNATASPQIEYRAALGCPSPERFEQELLSRLSRRPIAISEHLVVEIEFDGAVYSGRARTSGTAAIAGRSVRHESCEQVSRALALIGALLIEPDIHDSTKPIDVPPNVPVEPSQNVVTQRSLSQTPKNGVPWPSDVTSPPEVQAKRHRIGTYTLGPWFALAGDGLAAPGFRLGPRVGALLTFHDLVAASHQTLRVSIARIQSGAITLPSQRQSSISWSSLRLDACHALGNHTLSTVGACAQFDFGYLGGQGRVGTIERHQGTYWSRLGAALYLRQRIIEGLTISTDVGLMAALTRPEFYFAAGSGVLEETIHRVPRLGPVADLGLDLHFW